MARRPNGLPPGFPAALIQCRAQYLGKLSFGEEVRRARAGAPTRPIRSKAHDL